MTWTPSQTKQTEPIAVSSTKRSANETAAPNSERGNSHRERRRAATRHAAKPRLPQIAHGIPRNTDVGDAATAVQSNVALTEQKLSAVGARYARTCRYSKNNEKASPTNARGIRSRRVTFFKAAAIGVLITE